MSRITIDEALRIAADGDAILFLGAGIGAKFKSETGALPNGAVLSNRLLGRPDDAANPPTLDRASGYVLREGRGAEFVHKTLVSSLNVVEVDPEFSRLLQLPWRRIYTTNYDNGVEIARGVKSARVSKVPEDEVSHIQRGDVLHINGYIKRITPSNVSTDLSLTDASYADRRFESSSWYRIFRSDMVAARTVIFAGYSLYGTYIPS